MNPGCEVSFHNRTDIWAERNATETKFALGTDSKCCFEVAPSVTAFRCTCLCMFHSCCSTFLPAFMIVFHYSTASFLRNISCSSPAGHVGSLGSPPSSATLVHSLDEQRASPGLLTLLEALPEISSALPPWLLSIAQRRIQRCWLQVRTSTTAALRRQLSLSSSPWQ